MVTTPNAAKICVAGISAVLLIAGCSSSSKGSGASTTGASSTGTSSAGASTTQASTPAQSGNDNSGLTPADLDSKVLPAVLAKKTFHLRGNGSDGSGGTISFDIHFGNNGSSGTLGISGTQLKLLVVGTDSYLYGGTDFWTTALAGQSSQQITVATVANKWVKVDASNSDYQELFQLMDAQKFLSQAENDTSTVIKVGNSTYQGQQVVEFKDSSDGSHIYVKRYGDPLPLAIVSPANSKDGAGSFTFTEYGTPYTVQEPPAGQIFDLTKYQK